jgi:Concanavalin A-like lectin/glucanases superfamily
MKGIRKWLFDTMKASMKTTNAIFGILSLGFVLTEQAHAQPFLTNGLVAYYPFNGNAQDESGNRNNGVVVNATLTADRFGFPNRAYSFNGTSAYIKTTNALPEMESASVSFWMSVTAAPDLHDYYVFMEGDQTPDHDFFVTVATDTNIWFNTKDNSKLSSKLPSTNTWFQVVGVADNSINLLKIWVNGHLIRTSPSLGNANIGYHSQLYLGCRAVYADNFFRGALDDLRFYNRALPDSEVQQLYASESVPQCLPHSAAATATLVNGFVVGATITDGGCGYTNTPEVLIRGGGGTGASGTALVSNGVVVGITITDAGFGYTNVPNIYFSTPLGLQISLIKAVKPSFANLSPGFSYQLQVSTNLSTWTNYGSPFAPTNTSVDFPQYFDVDNWSQLYFRLQESH